MRRFMFVPVIILVTTTSTNAQWFRKDFEDPFGTDSISSAFTASGSKGLGIRCVGGKNLELLFIPNEQGDDNVASTANLIGFGILLRIDDDDVDKLEAVAQTSDGKIVAVANIEAPLAKRMASAKKRIAATTEFAGQKIGTTNFGVSGSRAQIEHVLNACSQTPSKG